MRALVLGADGQLGRALAAQLPAATALGRGRLDIADPDAVDAFDFTRYDTVFNAAGYTAVDRAETDRAGAWLANATGPANLASAAVRHGLTLVHVSTEYVFDGTAQGPVPEHAPLCPTSVYGASKAAGELAVAAVPRHVVARTSWLVGDGHNFVATMLDLARRGVCPSVVDDQVGRPTFAPDLARALVALAADPGGTYHVTNDGEAVSWADLAREVFALAGRAPSDVRPVSTAEYTADRPGTARRPANSVLDLGRLTAAGIAMPAWRDSLGRYLAEATT